MKMRTIKPPAIEGKRITRDVARDAVFAVKYGRANRVHVVTSVEHGYRVVKSGGKRALRRFQDKRTAVNFAKGFLKKGYEVIIHKEDGYPERWHKPNS